MKKSKRINLAITIFFIIAALDISGIIFDEKIMRVIFKPLISPMLMLVYLVSVTKINKLYVVALVFSFLADTLLLNSSNEFYMPALGFFLLMNLTYIVIVTNDMYTYKMKKLSLASVPYLIVLVFVVIFVFNSSREFLFPIIIYGIVVCIFCALSFYNYLEKKSDASLLMFLGSFFLITSNTMSGIEKFRLQNSDLAAEVMLTYVIAQFLIYRNMVKKSKEDNVSKIR